jgi:hypothetical protein
MRSRVELFEVIRRDARLEGMGIRALARKHRVHRRTVRQALMSAVPPQRKMPVRRCPVLDPWKPLIQAWVATDETLPKKQRQSRLSVLTLSPGALGISFWSSAAAIAGSPTTPAQPPPCAAAVTSGSPLGWLSSCALQCWAPMTACWA